jgi:GMP reductase
MNIKKSLHVILYYRVYNTIHNLYMSSLLTSFNLLVAGIGAVLLNSAISYTIYSFEVYRSFKKFVNPQESNSDSDSSESEKESENETESESDYEEGEEEQQYEYEEDEDSYIKIDPQIKLDFNDVLIVPKESNVQSRNDVSLKRTFYFHNSNRSWCGIPIIVANMDTTGTIEMAQQCQKYNIITCLHKFYKAEDIPEDLDRNYFMISTGTRAEDIVNCENIIECVKPYFVCIDVANGYSIYILETIRKLHAKYPDITLVAGNVVTYDMVKKYYENGVDIVKMGIGSGSVCTTRLQTGVGYPQLSCILDTKKQMDSDNVYIISDGGIQNIGDFSKAYGAGADFVMCGGMFSGHEECAGDLIILNGVHYKNFYGMSSSDAMNKHYGGVATYKVAEGKSVKIKYKGSVIHTLNDIMGGIRSSMTYIGATFMDEIYEKTDFIRVKAIVNTIYNDTK